MVIVFCGTFKFCPADLLMTFFKNALLDVLKSGNRPCSNRGGQISAIVKALGVHKIYFKQMRRVFLYFFQKNKKALDDKKLLRIFKQSSTKKDTQSQFTNIPFLNLMTFLCATFFHQNDLNKIITFYFSVFG